MAPLYQKSKNIAISKHHLPILEKFDIEKLIYYSIAFGPDEAYNRSNKLQR